MAEKSETVVHCMKEAHRCVELAKQWRASSMRAFTELQELRREYALAYPSRTIPPPSEN